MTAQAPQTADPADEIAILQAKLKEARERKAAAEAEAKEQRKAEAAQRRERKVAEYEDKAREHLRRMVAALVAAGYENEVAIEGFVAQRALDLLTQEQAAAEDRKARHIEHSKASAARRKAAK